MLEALVLFLLRHILELLSILAAIGFVYYAVVRDRPLLEDTVAHWHATIPGLTASPERFYETLSTAIKKMQLPDMVVAKSNLHEGHQVTYTRPYLRVRRARLDYYIFAARIGESFFVSSWLLRPRSIVMRVLIGLPLIGWLFRGFYRFIYTDTFYTYDSALHFNELIHSIVLTTVDALTSVERVPALPPEDRKPIMRELYARPQAPQLAL